MLHLGIVQQSQRLLWILLLVHLLVVGILATLLETVLELLLDRNYLVVERVVMLSIVKASCIVYTGARCLAASNVDLILLQLLLLLNYRLNESGLTIQIDAMLILQVVNVVVQKCLVIAQLLSYWDQADLVNC
jgi:hypothetical protein